MRVRTTYTLPNGKQTKSRQEATRAAAAAQQPIHSSHREPNYFRQEHQA